MFAFDCCLLHVLDMLCIVGRKCLCCYVLLDPFAFVVCWICRVVSLCYVNACVYICDVD